LVQIGPVVLEELIEMQKANDRRTTSGSNSSPDLKDHGKLKLDHENQQNF
jgi:hypothetical protein